MNLAAAKRIVVKVGSALLTDMSWRVQEAWLAGLAEDIAALRQKKIDVIIVTSGAVALGRAALGVGGKALTLEEKQAAAACGQIALFEAWRAALGAHGMHVAQLLLTIEDSENRRRYLNARNTLDTLLAHGVIPVINENDTVATAELRFGDNDRLAARVAQMASADTLVLLSDIDGLYSRDPKVHKDAEFIAEVRQLTPQIEAMAGTAASTISTGGMVTKLAAAKIALAAGCHMAICLGKPLQPLKRLQEGGRATWFIASGTPKSARKYWIAGAMQSTGAVVVDGGARAALASGKSLLPAGVKRIEGSFERGDSVLIREESGRVLGRGLSAYSSADAEKIIGHKSAEIEQILGFKGRDTLIHRDDMVLE